MTTYRKVSPELYHHGILGMKWGVQNGPPYPLDDSVSTGHKLKKEKNVKPQTEKQQTDDEIYKQKVEKIKQADLIDEGSKESERTNKAADVGVKALRKQGVIEDDWGVSDEDIKFWFVNEDQTIGLFTISDLVCRGKKSDEIIDLIKTAWDVEFKDYGKSRPAPGVFQLAENAYYAEQKPEYIEKFVEACEQVLEEEKIKHSDIASNYLEHHGILGMKWGVQNGPPYPLDAEDHSASEKKAGWRKSLLGSPEERAKKKQERDEIRTARKQAREEKKEAKWEKKKSKIIQKGDVKAAQKNVDKLSNEEIRAVIDRYKTKKGLSDLNDSIEAGKRYLAEQKRLESQQQKPQQPAHQKSKERLPDKLDRAGKDMNKIRGMAEETIKTWNTTAKIINATTGKKLPVIDLEPKKEKKETHNRVYDENGHLTQDQVKDSEGNTSTYKYKAPAPETPKEEPVSSIITTSNMNAGQDYFKQYYGDYDKKKKG